MTRTEAERCGNSAPAPVEASLDGEATGVAHNPYRGDAPPAARQMDRDRWFAAVVMIARGRLIYVASEMASISAALACGAFDERQAVAFLETLGVLPLIDDVLLELDRSADDDTLEPAA